MNQNIAIVKEVFDTDGWRTEMIPGEDVIYSIYVCDSGEWIFYARTTSEIVAFYSLYPEIIPPLIHGNILKLLMKFNDGLIIGNFEFNFENNEIRFKTSLETTKFVLSAEICRSLLYNNLAQMEKCIKQINSLIKGRH